MFWLLDNTVRRTDLVGSFCYPRARGCIVLWLLVVAGCAATYRDTIRSHWLDYPAPPSSSANGVPGTLMVYPFLLEEAVDADRVVVRGAEDDGGAVSHFLWARNPGDMITDLIQRDLGNSGLFRRTVGQFSSVPYRYALEGRVLGLRSVRTAGKPHALIQVDATLVDFAVPVGAAKNIMERRYHIQAPCKDSSAEATVQAFNEGLTELSLRLRKDIRSALEKTGALRRNDSARRQWPLVSSCFLPV